MAKSNKFKKGDLVSAKKLNGENFLGIYDHEYDCGEHCIQTLDKKFCVKHNTVKLATEEEQNVIKETIIKPMREANKKKALEKVQEEETLNENEVEELASESTENTEANG